MKRAFMIGIGGFTLTPDEKDFIRKFKPAGLILFARNVSSHEQIRELIRSFREALAEKDALVLIDQEGGRVQRLRPPLAPNYPSAEVIGGIYRQDAAKGARAAWLAGRLIADDLYNLGIDVDCDPVLDLRMPGAHDVIGNRSYGDKVETVVALASAKMEGLMAGGVLPVIKHMPGHGRAGADSHHELPKVGASHAELSKTDFATFKALNKAPFAMSAHVVYEDIDSAAPATTSKKLVQSVIRAEIGFDGALMTDDLGMKALAGSFADRAKRSLDAGCDIVLHCSGVMDEMRDVASAAPELSNRALARFDRALGMRREPESLNRFDAEQELKNLLAEAGVESDFELVA
jgi:beta-N-acetylhexosaminidase